LIDRPERARSAFPHTANRGLIGWLISAVQQLIAAARRNQMMGGEFFHRPKKTESVEKRMQKR
jgi:hypothetical protein